MIVEIFKNIDEQLHLNHAILEKYFELTKGEEGIPLDYLEKQGFDPTCHLGVPLKLGKYTEPDTFFYSYRYKFRYDRESNSIRINRIIKKVKPRFIQ